MLYLKTVTLNNKQNRKLLQSDLWSSSRLISELAYSIMTVSFSWTIKEYPVPVSSGLFRRVCFLMFADLLFNFQSFLLSMNFIKRFWLNRYYNVSSSFNTVFVEHWYTCQLSRLRRESHACGLKTSISRRLTPTGQFLTPDWKMWVVAVLLDTISKNMLTQTHVGNENHV